MGVFDHPHTHTPKRPHIPNRELPSPAERPSFTHVGSATPLSRRAVKMSTTTIHQHEAHERPKTGLWLLAILLIVAIAIGAWAYFASRPQPAKVVQRDIIGLIPLEGEIAVPPNAKADVYAPFQAPVEKVHVTVGAKVNRGDVLVELAYTSAEAAAEQARQNLKAAETAYANAKNQLDDSVVAAQRQL